MNETALRPFTFTKQPFKDLRNTKTANYLNNDQSKKIMVFNLSGLCQIANRSARCFNINIFMKKRKYLKKKTAELRSQLLNL